MGSWNAQWSSTKWDREARVGAMTRTMTRDVKDSVKKKIQSLYADENGELNEDYRQGCAEWHWNIVVYCHDEKIINTYTGLIELFYRKQKDPRKSERFKMLMRRTFPQQFIKKIGAIGTQVPIIAVMDDTVMPKETMENWWEE